MIRRIAALTTMVLLAAASLAPPALASPDQEAGFVSLINQERAVRGLNTLNVYWDLVDDARIHSNVMNGADDLFHSSNLASATTGRSALGENVGVGPSVDLLHEAFMNSAGHRDNILGDWDSVGVGVTQSDQGYMYVTVVFMKTAGAEPPAAPAPQPVPEPEPAPAPEPEPAPAPEPEPAPAPEPQPAPPSAPQPVASPTPAAVAAAAPVADPPVDEAGPSLPPSVHLEDLLSGRLAFCIL